MIVALFAGEPSPYLENAVGSSSTLERVAEFVSTLAGVSRVVVFGTDQVPGLPDDWEWNTRPTWSVAELLSALAELVEGPDDVICFTFLDQPFVNAELASRLVDRHARHRADYTFADGYPIGLGIELLRGRAMAHLRVLASEMSGPVRRNALFSVIQKDMNRFDIETELSRTDQRMLRLTLAVDSKANLQVCTALAAGAPSAIDEWPAHVSGMQLYHRSLPRYVSVQVLEQEVHETSYSPYPLHHRNVLAPGAVMSSGRFEELVAALHEYSPEAVVSISHWGEVALHPDVLKLVDAVLARPRLGLLIETSGVGWEGPVRDELFGRERVSVIVGLDTNNPATYRELRGEGFVEAVDFAEAAIDALGDRAYVQAIRCDLTEPTLDDFYHHWHEKTSNVIIQKYDWFSARLPDRRVGDLAPLKRFPCWHLQRDMVILVDGNVPLCREDLDASKPLGNVFTDGLDTAWRSGAKRYEEHVAGSYAGVCEQCDEYYTFNF